MFWRKTAPKSESTNFNRWNSGNPCYHCQGACCENVRLELSDFPATLQKIAGALFPFIKNIGSRITVEESTQIKEIGVYHVYSDKTGREFLTVIGRCPLLGPDGNCTAHNGTRPLGCVTSDLNSLKCIVNRRHLRD